MHDRNQNARKKIEELKETFELLWRQTSPIKQSRIDYFLVSEDIFSLMEVLNVVHKQLNLK
jgi:hypothetical protein